jgi:SAM-dependent methyltransferase
VSESHKAQVQAQFGASAHDYVTSAGHAGGADLEQLVAWGKEAGAPRVLDVATGGGHTALAFSAFTPTVISTDLTPSMLRPRADSSRASPPPQVPSASSPPTWRPYPSATAPTAWSPAASPLITFPPSCLRLKEVARVLRPGGSLLVEDILGHDDRELAAFILEVEKRRDPSHVRALTHREWEAFLKAAGMTVIDESTLSKSRPWEEWTARMRMTPEAKADLERFVRDAPERCREAFGFTMEDGRIQTFADRLILIRADRD